MGSIPIVLIVSFIGLLNIHANIWGELYLNIFVFIYFIGAIFIAVAYGIMCAKRFMISYKICLNTDHIVIYYNGRFKYEIPLDDISEVNLGKGGDDGLYRNVIICYSNDKKFDMQVGEIEKEGVKEFDRFFIDFEFILLKLNFNKNETRSGSDSTCIYSHIE